MIKILFRAVLIIFSTPLFCQIPTDYQWVKKAGGSQTEIGTGITTDRDSNVLVTGYFKSTATFGADNITTNGQRDAFVVKYDAGANYKWVKKIGGIIDDMGNGIATDNSKNVYVAGRYSNNITIEGTVNLTNNGGVDIFLVKYDSLGNIVRGKGIGGDNADNAEDMVIDNNGDIIIVGSFQSTVDFGGQSLTSTGGFDVFVAKYDTAFNLLSVIKAGGTSGDECKSIAIDTSNNIFITGYFSGTASFGSTNLTSTGNYDAFVVKYNSSGVTQWARKGNGPTIAFDYGYGIAADRFGNCVVVGYYAGTSVTFNSTTGSETVNSNGNWEMYAVKYNGSGDLKWLKSFGGSQFDYAYEVEIDYNGEIAFTGGFGGTVNFGPSTLTSTNSATEDLFVLKMDTSGNVKWVLKAGSSTTANDYVWGEAICIDNNGNVLVTGTYEGNAVFGTTNLTTSGGDESYGEDLFIAKISQYAPSPAIGMFDLKMNEHIILYPLPANDIININVDGANIETLELFNLIGKQLETVNCNIYTTPQYSLQLDLSAYPVGLYFVKIKTHERIITKKVLLVR